MITSAGWEGNGTSSPMSQSPDHLTLFQLGSHLWASANILRGAVDATDFKTFIFPLLFFKRISDVFDKEREAAMAEGKTISHRTL